LNDIDDELDEINKRREPDSECPDFELLISKECDGECSPEELRMLARHLAECPECRRTRSVYGEIRALAGARFVKMTPPEPPRAERVARRRALRRGNLRGILARLGGIAACILFFAAGRYWGQGAPRSEIFENASNVAIATPSMWVEGRSSGEVRVNVEAEQPFTDSISRYRSAIGEELRKDNVDWVMIRELVEAMGDLRTDLELLTIHMAFIDIRTGSSPVKVAEHWEKLGKNDGKAVYAP
jgi:hypothetical protein